MLLKNSVHTFYNYNKNNLFKDTLTKNIEKLQFKYFLFIIIWNSYLPTCLPAYLPTHEYVHIYWQEVGIKDCLKEGRTQEGWGLFETGGINTL